jgi:hypothetical protein
MAEKLTYQEILRTLGTLLMETTEDETAVITLSPAGAALQAPGWRGRPLWDLSAIEAESERQRAWRHSRRLRWGRPAHMARRLRAIGVELDAMGAAHYVVRVTPGSVKVEAANGYRCERHPPSFEERIAQAGHLRWCRLAPADSDAPSPDGPPTAHQE